MGTEMDASISLLTQCTCENDNCVVTCAPLCAGHKVEPLGLNCCSLPLADWDVALISSHGQPDFKHNHIAFVEGKNTKKDKYLPSKVPTAFVFLLLCYLNCCTLTLPAWFPIMLCGVGLCWLCTAGPALRRAELIQNGYPCPEFYDTHSTKPNLENIISRKCTMLFNNVITCRNL